MNNKLKGPAALGRGGEAGKQSKQQTFEIIRFSDKKRTCRSCEILFRPAHVHHRLCGDCLSWHRIYIATQAARQALQEVVP